MRIAIIVIVGLHCSIDVARAQAEDSTQVDGLEDAIQAVESPEEAGALEGALEESGLSAGRVTRTPTGKTRFEFIQLLTRRVNTGRGYDRSDTTRTTYAGSPVRALFNARLSAGRHVAIRFGAEKDAGEPLSIRLRDGHAFVDFVTATLDVSNVGILESLVVGDFVAHWGWGLLLGRPSFGIASRPLRPRSMGVRPYRGFNEASFYRGAAVTLGAGKPWAASLFASRRNVDAVRDTTSNHDAPVTAYRLATGSGLHRTETEMARRGQLSTDVIGGYVNLETHSIEGGVAAYALRFGGSVLQRARPDQHFSFSGQTQWGTALHLSMQARRIQAYTELALVDGRQAGLVFGAVLPVHSLSSIWVYVRHLSQSGSSLLGSVPRRGGGALGNESGITIGIQHRLTRGIRVRASHDVHWFGWLRFGVLTPTYGQHSSIAIETRLGNNDVRIQAGVKERSVATTSSDTFGPPVSTTAQSRSYRYSILAEIPIRRFSRMDVRCASTIANRGPTGASEGHLLAVDIRSGIGDWLEIVGRFALFDSDTGDARVYAYEPGLTYGSTIPSFSGNGERWMLVIRLSPDQRIDIRMKYSRTRWPGRDSAGSGLDETPGDRISTIGGEMRIRFR